MIRNERRRRRSMKIKIVIGIVVCLGILITGVYVLTFLMKKNEPSSESYLIRPGLSVGPISIGMKRDEVLRLAGEPFSSIRYGDRFSDFVVHYDAGRVSEIMVVALLYHTAEGICTETTVEQFLDLYPEAKRICYIDMGGSGYTSGFVYDAIDKGIAYERFYLGKRSDDFLNTIYIHRPNVPITIGGEVIPCENL